MDPQLAILSYLLTKHFVADFCLQGSYQFRNKGRYGHPGGILHSGIHAALTVPLLVFLFGDSHWTILVIAGGEFLVHYHIDYVKELATSRAKLTIDNHLFWIYFGFDQLAHQMTYVAMTAMFVAFPAGFVG